MALTPDAQTNIFYGENAQGKTNILEAVYLAATTKSHRGAKDREMIKMGEEEAHIEAVIEKKGTSYTIDVHLKKNSAKGLAVNHIPLQRAGDLLGLMNVVFFSPEDLRIIKDGPGERRRFLDLELSQLDKVYLSDLSNYNRVINQRNKLLKDLNDRSDLTDTIDVWDEQLVKYGNNIIKERKEFLSQLNNIIKDIHLKLSGGKETLKLMYESSFKGDDFAAVLRQNRKKDILAKTTLAGPHRDDIYFLCEDMDMRKYGSQGQQRTAALSLKMAEIEIMRLRNGDAPILLLDDVLSELDKSRQEYLTENIKDVQTFITCAGEEEFIAGRFHANRIYRVKNAKVTMN